MTRMFLFFLLTISTSLFCQELIPPGSPEYNQLPSGQWTLDWSADDKFIATGGDDSLLRIYDAATLRIIRMYRTRAMIRQVDWHPTQAKLAVSTIGNQLFVLDINTESIVSMKIKHGAQGIGWNYDGTMLAAADGIGVIHIWNSKGEVLNSFSKDDRKSFFALHWHPHKNLLITGGDEIRMFDANKGLLKIIKHREENTGVLTVRWHPSGNFFVSGDYGHYYEGMPSLIQFWNEEGELQKTIKISKEEYRVFAWTHDGKYLATTGDALRIWTSEGKKIFEDEPQRSNGIWGMAWNSDSSKLVTVTFSGVLRVWDKSELMN